MNLSKIVFGTCDGTGAAINVCLGFVPSYVKVVNTEDAGTLYPEVEWFKDMAVITDMDEGLMHEGGDDSDRQLLATGGISAYAGGDEIVYDGVTNNRWEDADGNDKEEVYVDGHYRRTSSSDAAYKCIGDSIVGSSSPINGQKVKTTEGFTIGTNADLNANGEQLIWMAIR